MTTDNLEFIKNIIDENVEYNQNHNKFTVLLNGQKGLENQLQQFKKTCESYDKYQRKRRKKRYYQLGLMAKLEKAATTFEEVKKLIKNNSRTFLLDAMSHKLHELDSLTGFIKQAEVEQQAEEPKLKLIIGTVLKITGAACHFGRFRNNCSVLLSRNDTITLTVNMAYRYSSFKEIAFAINLIYYLPFVSLDDEVLIGKEARGFVMKKLKTSITILIERSGIVNSYDLIELPSECYKLPQALVENIFIKDLEIAAKLQVDFIALQNIRSPSFLKLLQQNIKTNHKFKLIGSIDLDYISRNMLDTSSIIRHVDYLWLTNLFSDNQLLNTILCQDVIPTAKCLKKPIIGSVPLENCNDFKLFENHEFLWKIDCMFIEKSKWCNKYPLIVQKLLPIKNYRLTVVESPRVVRDVLSNSQSIVNFVIRTISSIECQAIFLYSKCETAVKALSRAEIYCPMYVMIPLEEPSADNMEQFNAKLELTKNLNLRRNLRPIPYTRDMNDLDLKPINYGIEYARMRGCLEVGDFIITIEVGKENVDDLADLGGDDDVVLLRAIYVPLRTTGERFKCL